VADPLRTLIVDDEPAAVRRLARLCEAEPALTLVGTANGAEAALATLDRVPVDLALLDIRMPGVDGLALAALIGRRTAAPAIVFTTAYPDFAVAAFGVDAVGYLTKPIDPEALAATVARVARRRPTAVQPDFWVPERGSLVRLETTRIDHVSGEDDYVRVHAGDRSWLLGERLSAVAERLAPAFLRIHRSHLVNFAAVEALGADPSSGWRVTLRSGAVLPIGRSMLPAVRARLGQGAS
jgi:two-component system, LytTR family, response regulator AlgR